MKHSTEPRSRVDDFHLIETMRHTGDGIVKSVEAHLDRAGDSAHCFGFDVDSNYIRNALENRLAGRPQPSRIRLLLYRDGRFDIELSPLPDADSRPLRLAVHPEPMDTTTCLSRHKTSVRAPYDRRRRSLPDFDDVIVVNERKELMETCTGNIVLLVDGVWLTPSLDSGCIPGIERRRLTNDGTLRERTLTATQLHDATAVAVINSLRGWRPAQVLLQHNSFHDRMTT